LAQPRNSPCEGPANSAPGGINPAFRIPFGGQIGPDPSAAGLATFAMAKLFAIRATQVLADCRPVRQIYTDFLARQMSAGAVRPLSRENQRKRPL
jgi:hypothetical protein